jgi:lipoprotein-releasing system ATP-binding protein
MIVVKNISKSFIQRGLVLDNLCLEVKKGDTIAIMGPSGSGKTTLMNIIGLLDKADKGDIFFKGESISGYNDDQAAAYRNRNIGFVFQDHLLLPHLTVLQNILLPLLASNHSGEEREMMEKQIRQQMVTAGISEFASRHPSGISGGEAQRVALVRALVNNPSAILADEPTGSLDSKNADNLGDLLLNMNKDFGTALIVATHSLELARKMSRILRLEDGKLVS